MRIGIDLGGTKIEAIALDDSGCECFRRRVSTPVGDYEATLEAITGLVLAAEKDLKTTGASVGVGAPGAISADSGTVKNSNSTCLNGKPLAGDLARKLGRPIRLNNDANCFALSEAVDGAAAGASVVFGVIIGTGTGGGIVVDGKVLMGRNSIAGEWGHNPLPWPAAELRGHHSYAYDERPGPACYCGKAGCIETFLSGPGLARDHLAATGEKLTGDEIAARAAGGDASAEATLARYETRLARALASIVNVLDPDVVVLGGGVSNITRLYQTIPALWGRWIFSDHVATRLVQAKYGDSSGVRGAAWLWPA